MMNYESRTGKTARLDTAAIAAKETAGQKTTPPGLPLPESDRPAFITEDCIRVTEL